MVSFRDPYAVLGLDSKSDERKVKAAYHREARRWHPDKQDPQADTTARFQQVQQAYEQILAQRIQKSAQPKEPSATPATPTPPAPRKEKRDAAGRGACGEVAGAAPVGTEEERRRRVEEHMQREAEAFLSGSAAPKAPDVRPSKASLHDMLQKAQERQKKQTESIQERLREWSAKVERAGQRKIGDSRDSKRQSPRRAQPEVALTSKGPTPRPTSPMLLGRLRSRETQGIEEDLDLQQLLEGNRLAVCRWYVLFRLVLLMHHRERAKARLQSALR
ncbi:unnamed protein product [Effrenium voratum]|nr:unnamed protein product [Effrenium voratum]